MHIKYFRKNSQGVAAIEFAIILPLLLLLLLGAVEIGFYIYKKQNVSRSVSLTANAIQASPTNPNLQLDSLKTGGKTIPYGTEGHYICAQAYDTMDNASSGSCNEGGWDLAKPNNVGEGSPYYVYLKAFSTYSSITGFGDVINTLGLVDFEEDIYFMVGVGAQQNHGIALLTSGHSWQVPDGVSQIKATIIGGGGGASEGAGNTGGGGAGGVIIAYFSSLEPGSFISYSIGSAGQIDVGANMSLAQGGSTTFNGITVGGGAGSTNGSAPGNGGSAASNQTNSKLTSMAAFPGLRGAPYSGCNTPTGYSNYGQGGGGLGCTATQGAIIIEW